MMTTVGRGRGNWGTKDLNAPLRRPGEATRTNSVEEDSILLEVAHLDLNDRHKIESLEEQVKNYCYNRENLWKITQKLYDSGLRDREVGVKVIKLWKSMIKFEVNEVKLRSVIMTAAQKDFEVREEIRKDDYKRFLNAIALFGGIFHYLNLPTGVPYIVLVNPMLEYLQLLLQECSKEISSREDELELLAVQLNLNGHLLNRYAEEPLAELIINVRTALVGPSPSDKCHYWLLLILDLSTHGWNHQGLPSYLKSFYIEKLGKSFHQLAIIDTSILSSVEESKKNTLKSNVEGNVTFPRKQEMGVFCENSSQFKGDIYDKNDRKGWQDGNADYQERRKPAYWGHDDRCDKQDDSYSGGGYSRQGSSERGPRRGGSGFRGNWRSRGDGRPRRDNKDGNRWNDDSQKEIPITNPSEESW